MRNFSVVLKDMNPDVEIGWRHELQPHSDWIENYVVLEAEGKSSIAFYEYYWDAYMIHELELQGLADWLMKASAGAKSFYGQEKDLAEKYEKLGVDIFKDGEFRSGGYLVLLGRIGQVVKWLRFLPFLGSRILNPLLKLSIGRVSKYNAALMGDLVTYTGADIRSKSYGIRQNVLKGAVEELRLLLELEEPHYEQIIVVAHSLGTLIAYDALNRINQAMNVQGGIPESQASKLAGLVTFGSPLDKTAFFFREQAADEEYVRRQILAHFHGFKRHVLPADKGTIDIKNPIKFHLEKARWLNFYHVEDLVSGSLDAFEVDQNIQSTEEVTGPGDAHRSYWTWKQMYTDIAAEFFQ